MEAARNLISPPLPFPSRTTLRNSSTSSSVSMFHEQASGTIISTPAASISRHFPTSVLLQEQRDESRSSLHTKEERTSQFILDRKQMRSGSSGLEDNAEESDDFLRNFEQQLLSWPLLSLASPSLTKGYVVPERQIIVEQNQLDAVSLAHEALSASLEAALLAEDSESLDSNFDASVSTRLQNTSSVEEKIVRSTRLQERRAKKRKVSKLKVDLETKSTKKKDLDKKLKEGYDQNDPLRLFLWGPETRKLLTLEEECQLISQIQEFQKLIELKTRLQTQFDREPTLVEWAHAAGLSCRVLQSQLHLGNNCREKLINANLRMVVHIAKQYLGRGLNFQDLLQEGSMGLMRSVQKFKPQSGCRFPSYAYWWVRQSIRKAIFQHSRTIRLPENVYTLQGKVIEAKKAYIQQERKHPSKEELAQRVGITVDKLQNLLFLTRTPISLDQPAWTDQDTTFQEITADSGIETPDMSVEKQMMRQHVRCLLGTLSPKERRVLRLRHGIGYGKQYSLSEIGAVFGLSKERVRQLESRAIYKLKQNLSSHGLRAYVDLLV
ncbi:hypothetical protein V2J09_009539 [Rumex salicifolius]